MPKLQINGIPVDAPQGATLLEAAKQAGIDIPALCHWPGMRPLTSCMICAVEDKRTGRNVPACSVLAQEGMEIETDTPTLRRERRAILELLLSEHAGDCEAPCRRMCPAGLNIPLMLRHVVRGDYASAAQLAAHALTLPATLGWVCAAPCEAGCRRGALDEAVAIRDLHRQVGEWSLSNAEYNFVAPRTGEKVAVAGAGAAGLAAAWALRLKGYDCHLYEKEERAGGSLRGLPEEELPKAILDAEIGVLEKAGIVFHCVSEVGEDVSLKQLRSEYGAVVIACGILSAEGEGVFMAEGHRLVIRSIASGKNAAAAVHRFLASAPAVESLYDSSLGRIGKEHILEYAAQRVEPEILKRSRCREGIEEEAERCLHCDCHAAASCKLRRYATEYEARPHVFRSSERPYAAGIRRYAGVVFEPGKCIKCGLCVELTQNHREALGLTFSGRGFNIQVGVPFDGALESALTHCAQACVEACPTGALVFADQEERKA